MTAAFPRIQASGDQCLVVEFDTVIDVDVNRRACAFARRVLAVALAGVLDVVTSYTCVGVHYRAAQVRREPRETPFAALQRALLALLAEPADDAHTATGHEVQIPVCYGGAFGPDLADVAAATGLSEAEVIRLHGATAGRVFMIGFAPGHPFIGLWDERLAVPRRQSPRTRVPAGTVAIANRQGNVYPFDLPGGWNLIGRTPLVMFDPRREPPGLLQAGDTVRFVPLPADAFEALHAAAAAAVEPVAPRPGAGDGAWIEIVKPGLLSSFQDLGRWGAQPLGVPVSGAMDELAHRLANLAVGNAETEATLEVTLTGPVLRFTGDAVVAWAGADLSPTVFGVPVPACTATFVPAGGSLQFGARVSGLRACLAVQGGCALAPVMDSASTYARARFGGHEGRALRKGDRVRLRIAATGAPPVAAGSAGGVSPKRLALPPPLPRDALAALQAPGRDAPIRLLRGREWAQFDSPAHQALLNQPWRVGAQSDRMGYRLAGPVLVRATRGDLLSEPVSFGTVQVPPDGQPIVLMADRQTTGGYPKIAQVASVDLPRLAQCAPGEAVRFMVVGLDVAQSLLLARDAALQQVRNAVGEVARL